MKNGCLVVCLLIFGGFLAFGLLSARYATTHPTQSSRLVILRAAGDTVQMFDSMGADATLVRQFSSGTTCTLLNGPTRATVAGISMQFYKLNCGGTAGYVNAKWVTH